MAFGFINNSVKGGSSNSDRKTLLTGASRGTVIKSLEIITGSSSCIVHVIRSDGSNDYADIKIDMKANDYLVLWEGFFVLPSGHSLVFTSESSDCTAVVNAVEVT